MHAKLKGQKKNFVASYGRGAKAGKLSKICFRSLQEVCVRSGQLRATRTGTLLFFFSARGIRRPVATSQTAAAFGRRELSPGWGLGPLCLPVIPVRQIGKEKFGVGGVQRNGPRVQTWQPLATSGEKRYLGNSVERRTRTHPEGSFTASLMTWLGKRSLRCQCVGGLRLRGGGLNGMMRASGRFAQWHDGCGVLFAHKRACWRLNRFEAQCSWSLPSLCRLVGRLI